MANYSLEKEWRLSFIQAWRAIRETKAELERRRRIAAGDTTMTAAQSRRAIASSLKLLREAGKSPAQGGD